MIIHRVQVRVPGLVVPWIFPLILTRLHEIQAARRDKLIAENPCDGAKLLRHDRGQDAPFQPDYFVAVVRRRRARRRS